MFKRFRLFIALFWAEFHERCAFWRLDETLRAAGADKYARNVAHCQPKMDERDRMLTTAKIVLSKKGKVSRPRPMRVTEMRVTEALSMNEKREALRMALQEKFRDAYICDFYDDYVVYELWDVEQKERLFKADYTMTDEGAVTLSDGIEVRREVNYEPLKDAPELVLPNYGVTVLEAAQEIIPICEAAKSKLASGEALVKVLAPGWNFNSSIYYPADVIKRDISSALPDGTKCFADHRPAVNGKRPEGSIERVAGIITGGAFWMENGPDGPGGYANVRLTETWKPTLVALKDDIGTSIDLDATPSYGTVDGKSGIIVKRLYNTGLGSLDFVAVPGAGGKFISIQEAARELPVNDNPTEENTVTPEEKAALEAENARLKAQIAATQRVTEAVQEIGAQLPATLPALTRQRLIRTISENAPAAEDGTLDKEALTVRVTEAVTEAQAELAEVAGNPVRGMGASTSVRVTEGAQENGTNNDGGAKFDASNIIGC